MKLQLGVGAVCLCLAACAPPARRSAAVPAAPAPVAFDDPDGAAEYHRLMRVPPGESQIPIERYLSARDRIRRMPVYSTARRSFTDGPKRGSREAVIGPAGGGSWEELGPGNIGGRTRSLLIHPADPNIMYAAGVAGGVWKTEDAGNSWRPLNDLLPRLAVSTMAMDPKAPDTIYAGTGESFAGDGLRGLGIYRTTDGGLTFEPLPSTLNSNFYFVNKLAISPNDSQIIYAATQTGVWRSLDGGASFDRVLSGTNLICTDLAIRTDITPDYMFAACRVTVTPQSGSIYRNTDAAGSGEWTVVLSDPNMRRSSLAIAPSQQGTIYAMAATGETGNLSGGLLAVYRSTSNGDPDSWEPRATNQDPVRLNTTLLTNPSGNFADICSNGTRTYSSQGNYDNALAVDPINPDIVWAGGIDLFRSDDGGKNWGIAAYWNAVTTFRTYVHADAHVLVFHPGYDGQGNQTLFAATDGGLFRTNNALAPVATGERAACSTANSEVNWSNLNNGYGTLQFYHGAVYPGGHFYFGGTQDNGTPRGGDNAVRAPGSAFRAAMAGIPRSIRPT